MRSQVVRGRTGPESRLAIPRPDVFANVVAINPFRDDHISQFSAARPPGVHAAHCVHYLRQPFQREPDFGVTSVNYSFADLLGRADKQPQDQYRHSELANSHRE